MWHVVPKIYGPDASESPSSTLRSTAVRFSESKLSPVSAVSGCWSSAISSAATGDSSSSQAGRPNITARATMTTDIETIIFFISITSGNPTKVLEIGGYKLFQAYSKSVSYCFTPLFLLDSAMGLGIGSTGSRGSEK